MHKVYTSIRKERFDLDSLADEIDAINRQLDFAEDELIGNYPYYVPFQSIKPPKKEEEEIKEETIEEPSQSQTVASDVNNATTSFSTNQTDASPSSSFNLIKTRNQTYIKTPTTTKIAQFGTPREKLVFTPKQTPRRNTPARPVLPIPPPSSAKISKSEHPWKNTPIVNKTTTSVVDSAPKDPPRSHPACLDSIYAKFNRWV